MPPTFDLAADLALIGLRLIVTMERCGHDVCRALDTRFDSDAIAVGPAGRPCFVAWREQPDHDYQTLTVREITDRGGDDSQVRKLLDGRSKADLYLQSYPSGVVWALASIVRAGLATDAPCWDHERMLVGGGGQHFRVLCASCCPGITYVRRVSAASADAVSAADARDPFADLDVDWPA